MATFKPGEMNRPIYIEETKKIKDSHGALESQWIQAHSIRGHIQHKTGNQFEIKFRYIPNVNTRMRVREPDGTIYDILSHWHYRYQYTILTCQEMDNCEVT